MVPAYNKVKKPQVIAVIDDEIGFQLAKSMQLERLSYTPISITGKFDTVEQILTTLDSHGCEGALVDNRLRTRAYANFYGAELAARMNRALKATVLVSQFLQEDTELVIRQWNKDIPVVITKSDASRDETILSAFDKCVAELSGDIPYDRRTSRVLAKVESISNSDGRVPFVHVRIRSWDASQTIRIPMSLIPEEIHRNVLPGQYLIASVNVGCSRPEDLFLKDFSLSKGAAQEEQFVNSDTN